MVGAKLAVVLAAMVAYVTLALAGSISGEAAMHGIGNAIGALGLASLFERRKESE